MLLLKRNPLKRKNNNMEQLQKMGIQIGFLFSGLFGAILMTTKSDKTDKCLGLKQHSI